MAEGLVKYTISDIPPHKFRSEHGPRCVCISLLSEQGNPTRDVMILWEESFTKKKALELRGSILREMSSSSLGSVAPRVRMLPIEDGVIQSISPDGEDHEIVSKKSDIEEDFGKIVEKAIEEGASDIHIKVDRVMGTNISFRIGGRKKHIEARPADYGEKMIAVVVGFLASQSGDTTYQRQKGQHGTAEQIFNDMRYRLRIESFPTESGLKLVMRIAKLDNTGASVISFEDAGYLDSQILQIRAALMAPSGAILLAGSTGSGKTTTMQSMMTSILSDEGLEGLTVESPVEVLIKNATQISVSEEFPFGKALESAMRGDPDVLMVGEIRDKESADVAIAAAITGHKFISTIHAGSTRAISTRFDGFGVSRHVLGSSDFYKLLIYQALAPHICEKCKLPLFSDSKEVRDAGIYIHDSEAGWDACLSRWNDVLGSDNKLWDKRDNMFMRNPDGCEECHQGQTRKRSVIAEVVTPDSVMFKYISERNDAAAWDHWLQQGGISKTAHAIHKVSQGYLCAVTAEKIVGPITHDLILEDGVISESELGTLGGYTEDRSES